GTGTRRVVLANLLVAAVVVSLAVSYQIRRLHRFDGLIMKIAREYDVDPRLIATIVWMESRFDPSRIGGAGEVGLMQVTEAAAADWAAAQGVPIPRLQDLADPALNLRIGTWYLARALRRWAERADPLPFALAEYNAGPAHARRWAAAATDGRDFIARISYPETKAYVIKAMRRYRGRKPGSS
ncbi:MAG TPA: lytic transglycosylase domain-containing protein, partial [Kiritimatiellae bacterium]|nr:lytic transglycosylase domain-containing protein [Kiritimatiellia bacterium]